MTYHLPSGTCDAGTDSYQSMLENVMMTVHRLLRLIKRILIRYLNPLG